MKIKKLITVMTLFIIVLFSGCAKDDFQETNGICPEVSATSPTNGETSVPLNKVISATFNKEMNPATITQTSFTISLGTTPIAGTISYSGKTAFFTPTSNLVANKTYVGKITTFAKDLKGNALQKDYIWSFSTGLTLIPLVIETDPARDATGVVLNKVVRATFNTNMDALSITTGTTFTLKTTSNNVAVAGVVSYSGTSAFFTPNVPLTANTVYTATITTAAKNVAGVALQNNYVWNFTTGTTTAPVVISTNPFNTETGVQQNKIITATFNMPMDGLTITTGTTFTLKTTTTNVAVAGNVTYSGSTATFTPAANLALNTNYTATITTAAKNLAGVPLANNYVWTFSTITSVTTGGPFVELNSVARFGIIAGVGVRNNAGFSEIRNMDVGISPGVRSSITGFPPAIVVNGAIYASDDIAPPGVPAMLIQAKQHLTDAYLFAEGATSPAPATVSGDQGGLTLTPGIYKSTSTLLIQNGNLTLNAQGNPNAVWIFQIASDFTTVGGAGGSIILSGGALAKNVFWQVGSSATIGDNTSFKGNVLALTSITMNANAVAEGRMLARNGSVVMTSTNIINKPL